MRKKDFVRNCLNRFALFFSLYLMTLPLGYSQSNLDAISDMVLDSLTIAKNSRKNSKNFGGTRAYSYHNLSTNEQYRICTKVFNNVTKRVYRLAKILKDPYISNFSQLGKNLRYRMNDCKHIQNRLRMLTTMNGSFNFHHNKVGIILPLGGKYADLARATLDGIKLAVRSQNVDFDRFFIVLDSSGTEQGTEAAIARHLLKHEVTVLVGGLTKAEAKVINQYSKAMRVPALILNPHHEIIAQNKHAFQLFPNSQNLASTIVQKMKQMKFTRIAILRPNDGRADSLIQELKNYALNRTIEIDVEADYEPGNYESMNLATEKLFDISMESRLDEYKQMVEDKQKEAEEGGFKFKPESVILAPKYEFQIVLIPDDFRVMRHFTKLMQFHNVESMPLVGNHMWRSAEILKPWDDFLEGAFFVDFIGSYLNLPLGIYKPTSVMESEYFTDPSLISMIDYKLVGYRSGEIGLDILRLRAPKRREISSKMLEIPNRSKYFNGKRLVFNSRRHTHWPVFKLYLKKDGLMAEKNILPTIAAPQKPKRSAKPNTSTGWNQNNPNRKIR